MKEKKSSKKNKVDDVQMRYAEMNNKKKTSSSNRQAYVVCAHCAAMIIIIRYDRAPRAVYLDSSSFLFCSRYCFFRFICCVHF